MIFHSYVSLPEGKIETFPEMGGFQKWRYPNSWIGYQQSFKEMDALGVPCEETSHILVRSQLFLVKLIYKKYPIFFKWNPPWFPFNAFPWGFAGDVSAFHLLPCYNTQLLRRYAALLPSLATLVLALKRWAKRRRLAKTWEHYISSYSALGKWWENMIPSGKLIIFIGYIMVYHGIYIMENDGFQWVNDTLWFMVYKWFNNGL